MPLSVPAADDDDDNLHSSDVSVMQQCAHCIFQKTKTKQKVTIPRLKGGKKECERLSLPVTQFKKKIDRDRHLFVHDIRDMNMTHQCELCDYQASRRVYLEKHYLKHRVLYCCCLCPSKFLSTIK